jgi:hypothetical protein
MRYRPPGATCNGNVLLLVAMFTMTVLTAVPPAPLQLSVKLPTVVSGPVLWLPLVAFAPLHPPDAVHDVTLLELHVSVLLAPLATTSGEADSVTVGAVDEPPTFTDALACAEPPAPVQLNVYDAFAFNAPVLCVPLVALPPLQLPEAVHDVAFVVDHASVLLPPALTDDGDAVSVMAGAGVEPEIETATLACAEPPAPLQLSVYAAFAVSTPVLSLPDTAFAPLQPPVAVQAVAFVLDQVSVLLLPVVIEIGLADNDTVGVGEPPPEGASVPPPPHAVSTLTTVSTVIRKVDFMAAIIRTATRSA